MCGADNLLYSNVTNKITFKKKRRMKYCDKNRYCERESKNA